MSRWSHDSRAYREYLREIQETGPTCFICGHPGSDSIHHPDSQSENPDLAGVRSNWVPSHGIAGCPYCPPNPSRDKRRHGQPQRCNQALGNRRTMPKHYQENRTSRDW